jgi:hypothetical protein
MGPVAPTPLAAVGLLTPAQPPASLSAMLAAQVDSLRVLPALDSPEACWSGPLVRTSAGIGERGSGQRPQCHREAGGRSGHMMRARVQERQAAATGDGDGVAEDSDAAD